MTHNPHNPPSEPRQPFAAHIRRVAASGGAIALIAGLVASSALADGDGGISSGGDGDGGGGGGGGGKHAYVFPLPSKHTYGDGFGAGRNHQGQDLFAPCGRKLVAVRSGRVQTVATHTSAGNYIVIDGNGTGVDTAYMHLKNKAIPREGSKVRQGEKIGEVGETGNASGCHLHFEKWTGPGYYEGGHASSTVTRSLRKWDKWS
ncbi:MAG: M23 family metallopeptidase [Actinomycetota bacterium]|nr:M23 family metallopeptidase [Actinomycetota bacterium]